MVQFDPTKANLSKLIWGDKKTETPATPSESKTVDVKAKPRADYVTPLTAEEIEAQDGLKALGWQNMGLHLSKAESTPKQEFKPEVSQNIEEFAMVLDTIPTSTKQPKSDVAGLVKPDNELFAFAKELGIPVNPEQAYTGKNGVSGLVALTEDFDAMIG